MSTTKTAKSTTTTSPKTTSLQRARATAANMVAQAKAAHTAQPSKASKPAQPVQAGTARYNYQQRVVANPKAPAHNGFFGTVAQLASKPITLEALVAKVLAATGKKLTSKKPAAFVVRVRVRHAHSRLGILQSVK